MKRFIAILIALTMLMGLTAVAESSSLVYFGNYAYDASGSVEYKEPENGYTMIDYGDYVITIEFFELAANGFDQAFFDSLDENDGVADSWEMGSMLLSVKYGPNVEDPLYAWYEEEPIDKSFNVDAVLFNGQLPEDFNNTIMAGIAFVADGNLLLFEVISFADHDLAEMQALRSEHVQSLTYNGNPVAGASSGSTSNAADALFSIGSLVAGGGSSSETPEEAPAEETTEEAPSGNVLGNLIPSSSDSSSESTPTNHLGNFGAPQNPAPTEEPEQTTEVPITVTEESDSEESTSDAVGILAGIGSSLTGGSTATEETTETEESTPTNFSGLIGSNISAGIPASSGAIEGVELGRYVYDVTGCEEYELEAGELKVDYGDRVIYMEYGTFEEYGVSFDELAEIGGIGNSCVDMAWLFYNNSDYADPENGIYSGCEGMEFTEIAIYPEGVMFIGSLTEEYGSGPIVGCVLVTGDDIMMYECVSFSSEDTTDAMIEFFYETLGNLGYDGAAVLR